MIVKMSTQEIRNMILEFLKKSSDPVPTLTIAKHANLKTTKEVNPTLYSLQKEGLINKIAESNGAKPRWFLVPSVKDA